MAHPSDEGTHPDPSETLDVSRTVQSSDLFTPFREPRVTLPSIGSYQQNPVPFGGKYWGGPLTEYGGIGQLKFIGRQRVRDLEVTRSHRHYRSGFSKYLTGVQPYRRTELHLSECRLNDQILKPSLQADISKLDWQRRHPWPDSHAYGTHRSIFDVFPAVRPEPSPTDQEPRYYSRSTKSQPLELATQTALLDLNRKLYQRTLYLDSYRDFCHQNEVGSTKNCDENANTNTDETKDVSEEETSGEDDEEEVKEDNEVAFNEDSKEDSGGCRSDDEISPSTSDPTKTKSAKAVSFCETPQVTEETIRHFRVLPNKPVKGVGPCWPPGTSYVMNNVSEPRLVERADVVQSQPAYPLCQEKPTPEKQERRRLLSARARLVRKLSIQDCIKGTAPPCVKASLKAQDVFLKERLQKMSPEYNEHLSSSEPQRKPPPVNPAQNSDPDHEVAVKLPIVRKTLRHGQPPISVQATFFKTDLVLPPAPLADCLCPAGSRTPHKLGLRYKSEAHKRYHLTYPDNVPDLRTYHKDGKQYFFFNFHSSVFRG